MSTLAAGGLSGDTYEIAWSPTARRDLAKLPEKSQTPIAPSGLPHEEACRTDTERPEPSLTSRVDPIPRNFRRYGARRLVLDTGLHA